MLIVEQEEKNNKPLIHLFYRKNKKRIHEVTDNFKPYFYTHEDQTVDHHSILKQEKGYTSIFNEQLKKITLDLPSNVPQVRNFIAQHYEADIPFNIRYMIDIEPAFGDEPRRCYLDIEIDVEKTFPEPKEAKHPISCITIFDSYTKKYYTLFLDKNKPKGLTKRIWKNRITGKDQQQYILSFKTEKELLRNFIKLIKGFDVDIFLGWNVHHFDMPYIINRMKNLHIRPDGLSPIGKVYIPRPHPKATDVDAIIKGRYRQRILCQQRN